jgi:hypothetical protein
MYICIYTVMRIRADFFGFGFGSEVAKFRNAAQLFLITNQLIRIRSALILLTNKIYFNN